MATAYTKQHNTFLYVMASHGSGVVSDRAEKALKEWETVTLFFCGFKLVKLVINACCRVL
jgi:hypothetical protein